VSHQQIARNLRRYQTDEENAFCRALRGRQFAGFKFRRQHVIGEYISDFYCADAQLAGEHDGFQHGLPGDIQRDERRERFLTEQGIETLRFWNHHGPDNREDPLLAIWDALQRRTGCVQRVLNETEPCFVPPEEKFIQQHPAGTCTSPQPSSGRTAGGS